jgi:GT2 family glycosyltransferase
MTRVGVTVVVPTLNRGHFLADCLRDLVGQHHRPLEILVVDQSSVVDSGITGLVELHPSMISYHRVAFRGLPAARNYGWQHAAYEAIIFVDDDIRCGPEFVMEHLKSLKLPGIGVVAGGIDEANRPPDPGPPTGVYRRWTATPLRGFSAQDQREVDHAPGGNFSAWRSALAAAGGFDESLNQGAALYEETELCLRIKRAGHRVYFNGGARLTHLAAASGGCRVEELDAYLAALAHNRGILIRRHGRWFHAAVALGRLALLGFSYARYYRKPGVIYSCLIGGVRGLRDGGRRPVCTLYDVGERP